MRVLHVLDAGAWRWRCGRIVPDGRADEAAALCAAVSLHAGAEPQPVLALGPDWFIRRAAGLGVHVHMIDCPPAGRPELSARTIRRAVNQFQARCACCWSAGAERAAVLGLGRDFPIVRIVTTPDTPRVWQIPGPRRHAVLRPCDSEIPPVAPASGRTPGRVEARASLGIGAGEIAVLLLGDGAQPSAVRFAFTLGLARYGGDSVVGLLPAWSDELDRATAFQHRLTRPVRLIPFERPRREILAAADIALWVGEGRTATWVADGGPTRMSIAQCLVAGIPVVAPGGPGIDDLYPADVAEACLAELAMPPELARRLLPLVESPAGLARMSKACREWSRGRDSLAAFRGEV